MKKQTLNGKTSSYDKKYIVHTFKFSRCLSDKDTGLFIAADFKSEQEANLTDEESRHGEIETLRFLISPAQAEIISKQLAALAKNQHVY